MTRIVTTIAAVLVAASLSAGVIAANDQTTRTDPTPQRYFHALHGGQGMHPDEAAMQVKGIAANRHVPVREVRLLMESRINGRDRPLAEQIIDVDELNQALDERWPIK